MAAKFIVQLSLTCWLVYVLLSVLNNEHNARASAIDARWRDTTRCNRHPHITAAPNTPADNRYRIQIVGNPEKYIPGSSYIVKLYGHKFVGFTLIVEPNGTDIPNQDIGKFKLQGDTYTKFSDDCPNAVVETSSMAKNQIEVVWVAPKTRFGCVVFKATVMEYKDKWIMDEDGLAIKLCSEENGGGSEVIDKCWACEDAKYEVMFQGLWSRHTHPKDFPQDNWSTHFYEIIGASHSPKYTMWAGGSEASDGFKQLAETAQTGQMEAEMKRQSHYIRTFIKARGLSYPNLNGSTFASFRVDRQHHLISLVSRIEPSPDWITGYSRMNLCLKDGSWVAHQIVDLYPWDAGTANGVSYTSTKTDTFPKEKIRRITTSYPSHPAGPFFDSNGEKMNPVARLTITRQRLYKKENCNKTTTKAPSPQMENIRMECTVTDWGEFMQCSATCGEGMQTRSRSFTLPDKARMAGCKTQLTETVKCHLEDCKYYHMRSNGYPREPYEVQGRLNCALNNWSQWSECSVTCGKGTQVRRREYNNPGRKTCSENLMEKKPCMTNMDECENSDDPLCKTTQWSEWSPCMATCGTGLMIRTRIYINPIAQGLCRMQLSETIHCTAARESCVLGIDEAAGICTQGKDPGLCRGHYNRWYFDMVKKTCLQFSYGGCKGNENNFKNYEECKRVCDIVKSDLRHQGPVDCKIKWSSWSPCSATCGAGHRLRHRTIIVHPQNGGKECARQSGIQSKTCNVNKPC